MGKCRQLTTEEIAVLNMRRLSIEAQLRDSTTGHRKSPGEIEEIQFHASGVYETPGIFHVQVRPKMSENLDDKPEWTTVSIRVPPILKSHAPALARLFDAMVFKLRRNSDKGKWEDIDIDKALDLLKREVHELVTAIKNGNSSEILMEAADVANFALITADIALEKRGV